MTQVNCGVIEWHMPRCSLNRKDVAWLVNDGPASAYATYRYVDYNRLFKPAQTDRPHEQWRN